MYLILPDQITPDQFCAGAPYGHIVKSRLFPDSVLIFRILEDCAFQEIRIYVPDLKGIIFSQRGPVSFVKKTVLEQDNVRVRLYPVRHSQKSGIHHIIRIKKMNPLAVCQRDSFISCDRYPGRIKTDGLDISVL